MKEDTDNWKDTLYSWIGRMLLKCAYYRKQPTDSMQSLLKFQRHFSQKQNKQSSNSYGTTKDPESQSNLEQEEQK